MGYMTAVDGAQIFYKDWGDRATRRAQPRLAAATADSWEAQTLFLAATATG